MVAVAVGFEEDSGINLPEGYAAFEQNGRPAGCARAGQALRLRALSATAWPPKRRPAKFVPSRGQARLSEFENKIARRQVGDGR